MNANRLGKYLDERLSPAERLALMISAHTRGDTAEADRLVGEAPSVSVTLPDYYGWSTAWTIVSILQLGVVLDLALQRERLWRAAETEGIDVDGRDKAERGAAMVEYLLMIEVRAFRRLGKENGFDALALWRDLPMWKEVAEVLRVVKAGTMSTAEATAALRVIHPGAKARTARSVLRDLRGCLRMFADRSPLITRPANN